MAERREQRKRAPSVRLQVPKRLLVFIIRIVFGAVGKNHVVERVCDPVEVHTPAIQSNPWSPRDVALDRIDHDPGAVLDLGGADLHAKAKAGWRR